MKYIKKFFKIIGILVGVVALGFALFLAVLTLSEYRPETKEAVGIEGSSHLQPDSSKFTLLTWNIGYCGLGKEMDFFYEGGTQVRPSLELYRKYRDGVVNQLARMSNVDFIFLQEVDKNSHRSYNDNQVEHICDSLPGICNMFALNYKTLFVPLPVTNPMGKVSGGLLTLSRYRPLSSDRFQFPSSYSWPKKLFMLKRCFMEVQYTVFNNKKLVLINTHNSAFDDAADMRRQELDMLRKVMESEYAKGNYVIIGGDWNQNPLPFNPDSVQDGNLVKRIIPPIPPDFLPGGWQWAYDHKHVSNRDVNIPYTKGKTLTTLIDFFVLSPNIKLISVNVQDLGFEYTDHQPVKLEIELIK